MSSATAGVGDPYWYEWFVGLIEVVELLDPATDIVSVGFQVTGIKGWDDVVVRLADGRRRCYQVKHTREKDRLTFGDLVAVDDDGDSFLRSLFTAWIKGNLNDGSTKCILYTNRAAGQSGYTLPGGHFRPPLLEFYLWVHGAINSAKELSEIVPQTTWQAAWIEWVANLNAVGVTDEERLAFLRALEIRTNQDDLDGLEQRVREKLAAAFGVPGERVQPWLDALHRALKRWTTSGHLPVTVEDVCSELVLPPESKELALAPPPPAPFFPSREPFVEELENLLLAPDTSSIVFLGADPGAGKTSVLSQLANRRADTPLTGLIGLRYFCFEPIRPDAPVISPDAGRVRPENLWFSLLTQLREGLNKRLRELSVPLRNDLVVWQEAKIHVLRLAEKLGAELRRPFVIIIDGIDHAARAAQSGVQEAMEFFASLPGPDSLAGKPVRVLIAGQPPEHYQQYPSWLHADHPQVRKISLERLQTGDVRALYAASKTRLPSQQDEEVIRLIEQNAGGNTLATVFSVAEAESVGSLEAFAERLVQRRLRDGLEAYYRSIWQHALQTVGDLARAVEPSLLGALSFAQQGLTPRQLAAAFSKWERPVPWWRHLLVSLGPMLTESDDGFRVRHNDVRVFLSARFSAYPVSERRMVASELVDYYRSPQADRRAAHRALFPLLNLAARAAEAAREFSVEWVFEAAAFGIDIEQLIEEFTAALCSLSQLRDWPAVLNVACAGQTLERLVEINESGESVDGEEIVEAMPPFLPSELVRTFKGAVVAARLPGSRERLEIGVDRLLTELGRLACSVAWTFSLGEPNSPAERQAGLAFDQGFVLSICSNANAKTLVECFATYAPHYLRTYELAVERFAQQKRWEIVRSALGQLADKLPKLSAPFRGEAAWWALRSKAWQDDPKWLNVLEEPGYGLSGDSGTPLNVYLAIAHARGWLEVATEPGDIADDLYPAFDPLTRRERSAHLTRLLFRTAALIGRVLGVASRGGWRSAAEVATVGQVKALFSALWRTDLFLNSSFEHLELPASLAAELAEICFFLGGGFDEAAFEAALPHAQEFPVDFRRPGLWSVLTKRGQTELLSAWVKHWLGADGEVWKRSASQRKDIVHEFIPLARDLGEHALAEAARTRLRRTQISYRYEERIFWYSVRWLRQLLCCEPSAWREEGWKLWLLSTISEKQGRGSGAEMELEATVFSAAICCGPSQLWQLLGSTFSDVSSSKWHYEMRNRLSDGLAQALDKGAISQLRDRLTLWCLVVAFCRWFDDSDVRKLDMLRSSLLGACSEETERDILLNELQRLTPGECRRMADEERKPKPGANPSFGQPPLDYPLDKMLADLARRDRLLPSDVAEAVCYIARTNHSQRKALVSALLTAVGSGFDYAISWRYDDRFADSALLAIVESVTDDELWKFVGAAARAPKDSLGWVQAIAGNLNQIALARSRSKGPSSLRDGLETQIAMNVLWAFGESNRQPPWQPLPAPEEVGTWEDLVFRMLAILLSSRSAEVISSASTAMHALVALEELTIPRLFAKLTDEWPRWWLLNAAEAWAALHPDALERVYPLLEKIMVEDHFMSRLQAWLILYKLADIKGTERPAFPMKAPAGSQASYVRRSGGGIFDIGPQTRGIMRFVDRCAGARRRLKHLYDCGFDFSQLESEISGALLQTPTEMNALETLRRVPHRDDDCICGDLSTDHAVGDSIDRVLAGDPFSQQDLPRMAQGFFDNEDPWLLRHTPLPSPTPEEWPKDNELGALSRTFDASRVLERCRHLALTHAVPEGWQAIGACVYLATWKYDFMFHAWLERKPEDSIIVIAPRLPSCPSGRTFLWWLGGHFEPDPPNGASVMAFFSGGGFRIAHSYLKIQPAKLWRELGWQPDARNPLQWHKDGHVVAFYQRLHGPLPHISGRGPHFRQPLLERWLVRNGALAAANASLGPFRMRESYDHFPVDFES
jgi:hypothetical protein